MTTRDAESPPSSAEEPTEASAPTEHEESAEPVDGAPSGWHRFAVTMLIMLTLLAVATSNAPDSAIKTGLLTLVRPYLAMTGLDQRWGVFAPNPRLETSNVIARIERTDGTVGRHSLEAGAGLSEYWNYRWRKYGEQMWTQASSERERVAFAHWVADEDRAVGHQPVRVTLLRITRTNLAPGPGPDTEPWREVPFFTLLVGAP